jgi:hypothetical protein
MTRVLLTTCAAVLYAAASLAQSASIQTTTASSPVAFLYFSTFSPGHNSLTPGKGKTQINAYSVASDGSLTKIPGSPFAVNGSTTQMCANNKYLFAATHIEQADNTYPKKVNSYRIASNGALTLSHVLGNAILTNLTLDHTGGTLYAQKNGIGDILAYEVRWSDGGLEYLGNTFAPSLEFQFPDFYAPLSFTGDNKYAYANTFDGYMRAGNHSLIDLHLGLPQVVSLQAAADPNGNLAGLLKLGFDSKGAGIFGVASYKVGSDGSLTTTQTNGTVPRTNLKDVNSMSMSPSGKILAVGGSGEVQLFHWNGSAPATPFADLPIKQYEGVPDQVLTVPGSAVVLLWDNANHLYAYEEGFTPAPSGETGYLYVWTVTPDGYKAAPGSPHAFFGPISTVLSGPGMEVLSLTH